MPAAAPSKLYINYGNVGSIARICVVTERSEASAYNIRWGSAATAVERDPGERDARLRTACSVQEPYKGASARLIVMRLPTAAAAF